jgi:hypothetical protein
LRRDRMAGALAAIESVDRIQDCRQLVRQLSA